jgi:hypothetical protein
VALQFLRGGRSCCPLGLVPLTLVVIV